MQKLTDFKAQVQDQFAHWQRFPPFQPAKRTTSITISAEAAIQWVAT